LQWQVPARTLPSAAIFQTGYKTPRSLHRVPRFGDRPPASSEIQYIWPYTTGLKSEPIVTSLFCLKLQTTPSAPLRNGIFYQWRSHPSLKTEGNGSVSQSTVLQLHETCV